MILFAVPILAVFCGGVGLVVFSCALPFLLKKPGRPARRYGESSPTADVAGGAVRGLVHMFDFMGRANRYDFWSFAVFTAAAALAALALYVVLVIRFEFTPVFLFVPLIIPLLGVAGLSMAVRRLHDVGLSGFWVLLILVFGYFILLYWFLQPSASDETQAAEVFS
ncbi:MAG TPA: DUF805 domain-containing protein [Asticcacaulis sp.]|nr:DUF805 domain-containing protein [Asticcacaulis sp.]